MGVFNMLGRLVMSAIFYKYIAGRINRPLALLPGIDVIWYYSKNSYE